MILQLKRKWTLKLHKLVYVKLQSRHNTFDRCVLSLPNNELRNYMNSDCQTENQDEKRCDRFARQVSLSDNKRLRNYVNSNVSNCNRDTKLVTVMFVSLSKNKLCKFYVNLEMPNCDLDTKLVIIKLVSLSKFWKLILQWCFLVLC